MGILSRQAREKVVYIAKGEWGFSLSGEANHLQMMCTI